MYGVSDKLETANPLAVINGPVSPLLADLAWRGLISHTTDLAALNSVLLAGPVTVYCGFDPTAQSLHFGNLLQLVVLRRMQRAGLRVLALVGGSTGQIGDPRASAERVLKTKELTAEYVARIRAQIEPFLDFDGANGAVMVNNLDWTAPISALDFLRDFGKHFRVSTMLRKEAVAARLASDEGISYTEFSYQILQALDYLHLYREFGCTLQTGGQDQWGNLVAGVDLVRKVTGAGVHALTTPLLTDAAGTKFGKSEGNAVWLNPEMTSPYAFYQYWINIEDASVGKLLKALTDLGAEDIAELERAVIEQPHTRAAQRALAYEVTSLVHGVTATEAAIGASGALFGRGELAALDEATLLAALNEVGLTEVTELEPVTRLMQRCGLVSSLSEARRAVADGGANVNNIRVTDGEMIPVDLLHGQFLVLRRGKKAVAGIKLVR